MGNLQRAGPADAHMVQPCCFHFVHMMRHQGTEYSGTGPTHQVYGPTY